jgi:hypothetical protein
MSLEPDFVSEEGQKKAPKIRKSGLEDPDHRAKNQKSRFQAVFRYQICLKVNGYMRKQLMNQ